MCEQGKPKALILIIEVHKFKNTSASSAYAKITSNPAWYAVQALPYLMEFPHECAEQIFARYYANSLAGHIMNSNHKVKEVFDQWASSDALISELEKPGTEINHYPGDALVA